MEKDEKKKKKHSALGNRVDDDDDDDDGVNEKCMIWEDKPTSTDGLAREQPERDSERKNER